MLTAVKSCDDNDLRLVGGELESEGRVEICQDNQFGTICDDTFDTLDAMVICRHLGYSGEGQLVMYRRLDFDYKNLIVNCELRVLF